MHPGMIPWWRAQQRRAERGARAGCGGGGGTHYEASGGGYSDMGGGSFGVRRPLRYLARRLDLDEKQVAAIARVIGELKTERAQAEVDDRRAVAAFADAVGGDTFDAAKAKTAGDARVATAERLRDAVLAALEGIHAALDPGQREQLAYMIRTGALSL